MIYEELWIDISKVNNGYSVIARRNEQVAQLKVIVTNNGSEINNNVYTCNFVGNNARGELTGGTASRISSEAGAYLYTFSKENLSVIGKYQTAYFELLDSSGKKITSTNFKLSIIDEADMTADQATVHVTLLDEIIKKHDSDLTNQKKEFEEYSETQGNDWKNFVEANKDIIADVDPGGKVLAEIVDARKADEGNFETVGDRLNNMDNTNKRLVEDYQSNKNKLLTTILDYMMLSITVGDSGVNKPSTAEWQHINYQGLTASLCVMVGIQNATDSQPMTITDDLLNTVLLDAKKNNVSITMLKPHIGVGYKDSFARPNYNPSSTVDFFINWGDILMRYAQVCVDNNIPVLCIGCEQSLQTATTEQAENWIQLINNIKKQYPGLLLTYAATGTEIQTKGYFLIASELDMIGANVYLTYHRGKYSDDKPTKEQLAEGFRWTYNQLLEFHRAYPEKQLLITEIGCIPVDYGLSAVAPYNYKTELENNPNYDVVKALMETAFYGLFSIPFVAGFAWWHTQSPFRYFADNEITSAEAYMKKQVELVVKNRGI